MARKIVTYTVPPTGGRDKGKVFILTEMPASQAEAWAIRALLALMAGGKPGAGGVDVPDNFQNMSMAHMAQVGFKALAGVDWQTLEPLLAEMWGCVTIQPDAGRADIIRALVEDDVEEPATRIAIRAEVFKMHTDFLSAAGLFHSPKSKAPAAVK